MTPPIRYARSGDVNIAYQAQGGPSTSCSSPVDFAPRDRLAGRILGVAGADEVLVSQTTRDLVEGCGLEVDDRGEHNIKGIDGARRLRRPLTGSTRAS